ncbi:hypothetical protein [Ectobacillus ponti]|uniref:YtxH domain-containing protein n=1 Tax=Ectobacillus ponti TaxID=2961894 RepID=A0AA42BQZ6_9BACI|nr:hypothetical protein [Ectobacillus ponti]MCP8969896.1 hypothetical protein [Ectobacillus ponti]
MEKKSTIVRNIAIGVAVGAAVTMLKKDNREKIAGNVRKARTKVNEMREGSITLKDRVVDGVHDLGAKSREMAELKAVKEKLEEIKKLTPAVVETLKETRDIFNKKKQELLEREEAQTDVVPEAAAPEEVPAPAATEDTAEAEGLMQPVLAVEEAAEPVLETNTEATEEEMKQTV